MPSWTSGRPAKSLNFLQLTPLTFCPRSFEGRAWDNEGNAKYIATGSAAGPSAAYLYKHNLVQGNYSFEILQGRFLGRPSQIGVRVKAKNNEICNVHVSGQVCKIANIEFV